VKVSKRTVAREWLIFLPLFVLGGIISFFVAYYWNGKPFDPYRVLQLTLRDSYDAFWNDWFGFNCSNCGAGFNRAWPIFLWFAPYLSVMLVRSIWWSIKMLRSLPLEVRSLPSVRQTLESTTPPVAPADADALERYVQTLESTTHPVAPADADALERYVQTLESTTHPETGKDKKGK
jgi:hypothetical protein